MLLAVATPRIPRLKSWEYVNWTNKTTGKKIVLTCKVVEPPPKEEPCVK
jgi:hypothetical protein